jgi:uncharacterized protein
MSDANARAAAALDPSLVLDGPTPRLVDEWQLEPAICNHVRHDVDDRLASGQSILTGSAVPAAAAAGMQMRPMSLFESGQSNGEVSHCAGYSTALPWEIADKPTPLKLGALLVNVAVGAYLILRLRSQSRSGLRPIVLRKRLPASASTTARAGSTRHSV